MLISVFTPSHNPKYLNECYKSLTAQTHSNWEWLVCLNGGAQWKCSDKRVHVFEVSSFKGKGLCGIGALKRICCERATGEIFAELDHDDLLRADCLAKLAEAFDKHPNIGFIYSNNAKFKEAGGRPQDYNSFYGWKPFIETYMGNNRSAWYAPVWEPTPQAMARIWFAPDHIRAWRRNAYFAAGGHDVREELCDDYSLMLRTYLQTEFLRLDEVLYYYRIDENTSGPGPKNALIQEMQFRLSDEYRLEIAETWAKRQGLLLLDLCSHGNAKAGYTGVDQHPVNGEIAADLTSAAWPFESNSVGIIRMQDALEHLPDKINTMREIHRILCHGGWLFADTPSSDGRGVDMDPTHMSRWNQNSFWYFTRDASMRFLPGYPSVPKFQCWDLQTFYYNDWYQKHGIPYVRAHLSAIKDGPRLPGAYDLEEKYAG